VQESPISAKNQEEAEVPSIEGRQVRVTHPDNVYAAIETIERNPAEVSFPVAISKDNNVGSLKEGRFETLCLRSHVMHGRAVFPVGPGPACT